MKNINKIIYLFCFLLLILSLNCFFNEINERSLIRNILKKIVLNNTDHKKNIDDIVLWVHKTIKFLGKNSHIETRPILRDDFKTILKKGGQCGEKARVMILLCNEIGINARRLYLFDNNEFSDNNNRSRHVIVKINNMRIDPQYLFKTMEEFPVKNLKFLINNDIEDKKKALTFINYYESGINYTSNRLTRTIYYILRLFVNKRNINKISMPVFLERPFLIKAVFYLLLSILLFLMSFILREKR